LRIIGDIFNCEVVFVSNSQFRGNFGGQAYSAPSGPIKYQAELQFFGYLLYKVEDPKLFVTEFFGNRGASTSSDIEKYISGFVTERVIDEFGGHDITNLVKNVDETTDKVTLIISDEAARIGLKILDCTFEGVKIPEEARRFASGIGQQAMVMQYMKETAAELPPGGEPQEQVLALEWGLQWEHNLQNRCKQRNLQNHKNLSCVKAVEPKILWELNSVETVVRVSVL
jgi:membrane protease subunit (stomatin/prohibitin family)